MREIFYLVVSGVVITGCQCGAGRLRPVEEQPDAGVRSVLDSGVIDAGPAAIIDSGVITVDAGPAAIIDAGVPDAGPMSCMPGDRICNGLASQTCAADGHGYVDDQGAVGCEFWPMVLGGNPLGYLGNNMFGLSVANDGLYGASVTIEGGELAGPLKVNVSAQDVKVVPLSARAWLKPFHLTSTRPVTVVQFNPLYQKVGTVSTHSADASRLRPTHTWGTDSVVASWENMGSAPGQIGIVANRDSVITITPRATTVARNGWPSLPANVASVLTVDAGTFIELTTISGDFTGSRITSSQPIEVLSGHTGTRIPFDVDAADHLEEAVLPISQLATEYFVVSPALPAIPSGKAQYVRIIAGDENIDVSYEPQRLGAPTHLEHVGDFIELDVSAAVYRVRATKKVMVAQYMQAQLVGGEMGDPSLFLPPPLAQFSRLHVFYAPPEYELNALDVVAPNGTSVTLDDLAVTGFTAIGTSNYVVARKTGVTKGPQANGVHRVVCSAPCMISVYGYGQFISYWY